MIENLDILFTSFLNDLKYIQTFIFEHLGKQQILLNKNKGEIAERDYSIKNSRIKGYAFHGYGCLFQFKDFHIDIDLRFDKIGFNKETLSIYCHKKGMEFLEDEIQSHLDFQIRMKKIQLSPEGIMFLT